jgi:hypothetical protein
MATRTFQAAHLAALLAVNTTRSAYTCADMALKLQSGMYCCVMDGKIEHLIQSKVKAAVENSEVRE